VSASLNLEPSPSSVDRASRFTEETLDLWALDGLTDIACLVVAELVRNAFEHARTAVTVDLQESAGDVRIAVRDGGSLSRRRKHRTWAKPTRGLTMVTAIASDWGIESTGTGKVVWAVVTERLHLDRPPFYDQIRDLSEFGRTSYGGFRVYMIDEPRPEPRRVGRAIVTAPDGRVAWLVWKAGVRWRHLRELRPPDDQRWGAWSIGLRLPLTTGEEGRAYFSAAIRELRPRWEAWHRERA
jgi:hypothetical protein